jgi:hypothetical protein
MKDFALSNDAGESSGRQQQLGEAAAAQGGTGEASAARGGSGSSGRRWGWGRRRVPGSRVGTVEARCGSSAVVEALGDTGWVAPALADDMEQAAARAD